VSPRRGTLLTAEERFEAAVPEGNYLDMAVSDGFMALAASDRGLVVFDVSDPADPVELGSVEIEGRAARVAIGAGYVYLLGAEPHQDHDLRFTLYVVELSDQ
jgi:hypothetical protein